MQICPIFMIQGKQANFANFDYFQKLIKNFVVLLQYPHRYQIKEEGKSFSKIPVKIIRINMVNIY